MYLNINTLELFRTLEGVQGMNYHKMTVIGEADCAGSSFRNVTKFQ